MLQLFGLTLFLFLILSQSYAQDYQILNYVDHGESFLPDTIDYVDGNSISLTRIEIRGVWSGSDAPTPAQALNWFADTDDDCPLATLDWAAVVIDTSWTDNGDTTFSASDNIRKRYRNGAWDATPVTTGWMAEDEVYTIEIQSVIDDTPTTLETFVFDIAGTIDFDYVEYRVNYSGERAGTELTEGDAYVRFRFDNATRPFVLPTGTESLRVNWKNTGGVFYTMDYPINNVAASEAGLNLTIIPEDYPAEGYFAPGDTIDVQVVLTNDGGTELNWNESATNGLDRLYYYFSGPKQDYEKIYYGIRVIRNGVLQTDPATDQPYTNPLKLVLPDTLPGDIGTYTIMIRVRRYFAGTYYFAELEDVQIGATTITDIPVGNCETCHNEQSTFPDMPVLENHGYSEWPQCLICHTDDQGAAFSKIVHEKTMVNTHFTGDKGDCSLCHIDKSNDQFTSDAEQVCTACHNPTPYYPSDHTENVPLYAESGMSCATDNCHQFGGLGVFKTIDETHAGITDKYIGGTLTASSTASAPAIDGVIDAVWDDATSITTLKGVELKALYDADNIYLLAQWEDGHNLMSGSAGPTESIMKNLWSHDGELWSKSGNEDRFSFLWDAGDSFGASCANMCHSDGSMATSDGNADVWHWKAHRTNPLGLTDDKWWSANGRDSDAKTVSAYSDNINGTGDGPMYSGPVSSDGNFIIIAEGGSIDDLGTDINTANTYPGYYLNANAAISGDSRWDVKTVGKFDEQTGTWTVEFQRAMDTGNSDDVVFAHDSEINFSTATFDNTGGGHASQGMDVGVYTLQIGSATDIETNVTNIPVNYELAQNYPNPFNPTTRIEFSLKEAGHVNMSIYDVLGQEVMQVVDRHIKAGHHWLTIKAQNLGSGIYFYKLSVNEFTAVKKMMLLK
jgi:hypothetical protein